MRFALVVRRLSTHGGTERVAHGFARMLVAAGHSVDVWCAGVDVPVEGVTIRPLAVGGRGRMWRSWSLFRAGQRIDLSGVDHTLSFIRSPIDAVYRAGGGCHRAWVEHRGWSIADWVAVAFDRRTVDAARRIVVNSEMARADIIRWYGVDPSRIRLVRNGVDLQRFHPTAVDRLPVDGPAVVFLGSGFARKGLDTAIRAIRRVEGVHLVVMGADAHPRIYRRIARRLGVQRRVHFLGPVARPEVLLPSARAMLLPTRYDPFANACLEAMACAVPVVTTCTNGAAELLPHPWMALDDPEDADGCAEVLKQVLEMPRLGAACRAVAEQHPHNRSYVQLLETLTEARV